MIQYGILNKILFLLIIFYSCSNKTDYNQSNKNDVDTLETFDVSDSIKVVTYKDTLTDDFHSVISVIGSKKNLKKTFNLSELNEVTTNYDYEKHDSVQFLTYFLTGDTINQISYKANKYKLKNNDFFNFYIGVSDTLLYFHIYSLNINNLEKIVFFTGSNSSKDRNFITHGTLDSTFNQKNSPTLCVGCHVKSKYFCKI